MLNDLCFSEFFFGVKTEGKQEKEIGIIKIGIALIGGRHERNG